MKAKVFLVVGVLALNTVSAWADSLCRNNNRGYGKVDFRCVQQANEPERIFTPWSVIARFYACDNTPIEMRTVEAELGSRADCNAAKMERMRIAVSEGLVVSDSSSRR